MRKLVFALLCLPLAACGATSGTTSGPVRNTTTISTGMSAGGRQGTATEELASYTDVRAIGTDLPASVDRVWAVLPSVYEKLGVSVQMVDPDRKMMGNRALQVSHRLGRQPLSRFVSCGYTVTGASIEDTYRVTMAVISTVQPAGAGSRVETTVTATAKDLGTSNPPVNCTSRENLEKLITNQLQIELATQSGQ